jgi:hypothetical protein
VQWCFDDARGYGIEAATFFCVLDCKTPGHGIQAPFRNHRNRGIFAGDWLIRKRPCDAHNIPRFLFQHLLHCELSHVKESQQVGRDQSVEVLGSKVDKRVGAEDSRVIDQSIDVSEVADRGFDDFGSGLPLPDIAIDQNQAG